MTQKGLILIFIILITFLALFHTTAFWKIYTNTRHGYFSIKYPSEWMISDQENYDLALSDNSYRVGAIANYNTSFTNQRQGNGVVVFTFHETNTPLAKWTATHDVSCIIPHTAEPRTEINLGDIKGIKIQCVSIVEYYAKYYLQHQKGILEIIVVTPSGSLHDSVVKIFDQMLSTLKFTQ